MSEREFLGVSGASAESADSAEEGAPELSEDEFFELVEEIFAELPADMVGNLDNVIITVETDPPADMPDLLGLYEGVDITERGEYGFGEMPDQITLFQNSILGICDDMDEVRRQIHITLVHEIAHYYGIDDDQLHELGWA